MFCFQTSFAKRERDKTITKNLSESEKNLNRLTYNQPCLCLSDSNLPDRGVNSESKKWERWRANAQIGYHLDSLVKNKNKTKNIENSKKKKCDKNLVFDETSSNLYDLLTKDEMPVGMTFSENQRDGGDSSTKPLSSNLSPLQATDIEYIDESESVLVDANCTLEKDNKVFVNKDQEGLNFADEIVCLENQKSIINVKAINNNSIQLDDSEDLEEIHGTTRDESVDNKTILQLSDVNVINKYDEKSAEEANCNLPETNNKTSKQHKVNSGSSFLSFCSLFHIVKSPTENVEKNFSKNNEIKLHERESPVVIQQNLVTSNLSCCPLGSQEVIEVSRQNEKHSIEKIIIINKSPRPSDQPLFPNVNSECFQNTNGARSYFSSDSSSGESSSDCVAPMASPEITSPTESAICSPKLSRYSNSDISQELCQVSPDFKNSFKGSPIPSLVSAEYIIPQTKFKLLHEGDIQVCYLNHTRTIVSKVLSSKFLRRWETHHVYLKDDFICSKTPTGFLESPVPYSNLDEVYVVGRWDQGNRFCIRLVMADGSLLLQTSNSLVRDQWLSSILWKKNMHKYRNILQSSTRPEVILKEIKGLIYSSLNSPLQDDCITNVPIEIISKVLGEDEIWNDRQHAEEVIVALAPLLEDSTPSPEMFQFFSRHCLCHPRSPVVVDIFTKVVHRILKRTVDFGKSPLMRRFVADYFKALHSQNDGDEAIRKFISSIHGTSCGCPHPRVLPNLVAVNLAAVFSNFEQRKTLLVESTNDANCSQAVQLLDKQLECFVTLFLTISEFEDWRPGLAQLLQPIPFPDDALSHEKFIKGFTPVIRKIAMDPRCDVHEMVLGIRENKEGWLNVICPSSLVCKDDGVLWCQMLHTLFYCCCRRKSFLQKMVKHLGALLLVALRGHAVAQEILCLMLEWRLIPGEDQEMQVVTTLRSTESGRQKYSELCKRQEHLRELQKEGGPKKLTLPSRSTDSDVVRLLSCGSFGNLECLSLAFTHVTSACAHQLIKLPALRYLNLWATQFGDAGLIIIAEHLDKLQVLNLCETPVSDKGISAISAMRNLKKLNLNSTKLSPQTLDTLKQRLPALQELDVRYTDAW